MRVSKEEEYGPSAPPLVLPEWILAGGPFQFNEDAHAPGEHYPPPGPRRSTRIRNVRFFLIFFFSFFLRYVFSCLRTNPYACFPPFLSLVFSE
jgi:hypothetical protein